MTITEFLLARIAEDEAALKLASDFDTWNGVAREVAECEAKRRIVMRHRRCDVHGDCDACLACGDGSLWPCADICALAAVYVDHSDFDAVWSV